MTSAARKAIAIVSAQFTLAGVVAALGASGRLPMHFDIAGQVDRWGGRAEPALVIAGLAGVGALSCWLLGRNQRLEPAQVERAQNALLVATSLVCLLAAAQGFGLIRADHEAPRALMGMLWLILAVIGAMLGKIAPNAFVGVRTPWTRMSRLAWDKSNRLAGRLFFWGGVVGVLVSPFTPQPLGMRLTTTAILLIAALSVLESWRVWRSDPDRRPV